GEPVPPEIVTLVGGLRDHPGTVETGAAIEAAFARQIDLGRDDAIRNVVMGQAIQGAGRADTVSRGWGGAILGQSGAQQAREDCGRTHCEYSEIHPSGCHRLPLFASSAVPLYEDWSHFLTSI